jgi:hypothetical protein
MPLPSIAHGARRLNNWIIVGGIVAILLLVAQSSLGQSVLRSAGLSRQTTPFLALYFPNANQLSATLPASGGLTVHFSIDNVGLTTRSVAWHISQATNGVSHQLAAGAVRVEQNRTVTVTQPLQLQCSGTRTELLVSLTGSSALVSRWLTCPNHS